MTTGTDRPPPSAPQRIVSLLPSATEIVCALGLDDRLVGVSQECDYPESVRSLPRVTRTAIPDHASSHAIDELVRQRLRTQHALYSLDQAELARLQPDLIVTQALCDVCAVAEDEVCAAARTLPGSPRIVNLEPRTLEEVLAALGQVAEAAGLPAESTAAVLDGLQGRVQAVAERSVPPAERPRVALLEWLDPPFSCGHWSPELVELAGGREGLGRPGERSRTLRWEEVAAWDPEVIVVACCGFPIERALQDLPTLLAAPGLSQTPAIRSDRVFVVDGSQYFSRPGPRLVDSLELLASLLHPGRHPRPAAIPPARRADGSMVA